VPPTERNGRVHTSTVTVACLNSSSPKKSFDDKLVEVEYYKSGGPGGQNKNKVETACRLKYGEIIVTNSDERSKRKNYERALYELRRRVSETLKNEAHSQTNDVRKTQIGSGQRGDKIRTYREKDNVVICHKTGQKFNYQDFLKGKLWI
jgi:peptide chain release factor 1